MTQMQNFPKSSFLNLELLWRRIKFKRASREIWLEEEVAVFQESQARYTSASQAPVCIAFAEALLTTESHTDNPDVGGAAQRRISGAVPPGLQDLSSLTRV
ncbi:unnamed protein product [Rangifer tarandus platyrhynchus]|uniref:Uncharacterized protein n=2 Tax=Rangifer tarandus platyrhynchus TaxID=3082113 RepID=A0AC59YAK0_RANTA|nr:unnamed protein product [Rangifer tarandus platyrhynchus]